MGLSSNTVKVANANMFLSPVFKDAFANVTCIEGIAPSRHRMERYQEVYQTWNEKLLNILKTENHVQ